MTTPQNQGGKPVWLYMVIGGLVVLVLVLLFGGQLLGGRGETPPVVIVTEPPSQPPPTEPPTQAPPQPQPSYTPLPTYTDFPTNTPLPTETATLPPTQGPPAFTASEDAFCRWGPDTDYDVRTGIVKGRTVPILGQSEASWGLWWYVEIEGLKCFVWSGLGTTSGDTTNVPIVYAPPTPTPAIYSVTFINYTGVTICFVFIRPSGSSNWGNDQLGPLEVINPGASRTFNLRGGTYDFLFEDCSPGGNVVAGPYVGILIDSNKTWSIP